MCFELPSCGTFFITDFQDPTIRAVAGKHARDFVPERLPWQILCRLTRVCQVTWFVPLDSNQMQIGFSWIFVAFQGV